MRAWDFPFSTCLIEKMYGIPNMISDKALRLLIRLPTLDLRQTYCFHSIFDLMKFENISFICVSLLFGCGELDQPNNNHFVIEGFITADFGVDDIKVKETIAINDSIQNIPITNAIVTISSSEERVGLLYNPVTEKYFDPVGDFKIEVGGNYTIEVEVDGTLAKATTNVPDKPTGLMLSKSHLIIPQLTLNFDLREQIERLFREEYAVLTWDEQPGKSYFVVIETQEKVIDPILPDGVPEEAIEFISSFRFISEPSETAAFVIFGVALETYGKHVAKVYSVNQEFLDLFNSAAQDSRDLNEPPSNIINGLGLFSAFSVDSLEFTVVR